MFASPTSRLSLDQDSRTALERAMRGMRSSPFRYQEEFLLQGKLAFQELPREVRASLHAFQRHGNGQGTLLVTGLPVDPDLGRTPEQAGQPLVKPTFVSEFCAAVLATPLGEIFSYAQERNGALFQNIVPTRSNRQALSSESSETLLDFHTEVAFHPHGPDYLLLYCLRSDPESAAATLVASLRNILPLLSQAEIALLWEPCFRTGIDLSFGNQACQKGNGRMVSVLYGNPLDPLFCFDPDLMASPRKEAAALLEKLRGLAHTVSTAVVLGPGETLIIDNRRAAHGRARFSPRFDGQDRWLQRTYIKQDLTGVGQDRRCGSRIVVTRF